MQRFKEGWNTLVEKIVAKNDPRRESQPQQLTKEEVERLVKQHYSALMKGIDTPEAQSALTQLKEQGVSPIHETCFNCRTKIITSW